MMSLKFLSVFFALCGLASASNEQESDRDLLFLRKSSCYCPSNSYSKSRGYRRQLTFFYGTSYKCTDCECNHGYVSEHGSCVKPRCIQCPANSSYSPHRRELTLCGFFFFKCGYGGDYSNDSCPRSFDDCECKDGYVKKDNQCVFVPPPPSKVTFYEKVHFEGRELTLGEGTYDWDYLANEVHFDDRIKSVMIPSGFEVKMCSDPHFRGVCKTFTNSQKSVEIGDGTSSIKIVESRHY